VLCVRWYLRYPLSYRNLEEMMAERSEMRHPGRSWRVDETYVRVAGQWAYLYRAIDSAGNTIDFLLSPERDLIAAKGFLQLPLWRAGPFCTRVINVDGHPASASASACWPAWSARKQGRIGGRISALDAEAWTTREIGE
jgi:transposase-like protein